MNDVHLHAIEELQPMASSGGRLDRLFRLSNVVGVVTIVPAFFYPHLMMYFLLLLGIAVALAAFLLVIQMPVLAVARVMERTRIEQPRPGERFEI
jgi:hypothetical protein